MFQLLWSQKAINFRDLEKFHSRIENHAVDKAAFFLWEEHCIECSPPDCYNSCALYHQRKDKKCARFVNGIEKISNISGGDGFAVRIIFRRWAKLESKWPHLPKMYALSSLKRITFALNLIEIFIKLLSKILQNIDSRMRLSGALSLLYSKLYSIIAKENRILEFDGLLFEFSCLSKDSSGFQFEIIDESGMRFRKRFSSVPGYNVYFIPNTDFPKNIVGNARATLWNEGNSEIDIVINWLHLVKFRASAIDIMHQKIDDSNKNQEQINQSLSVSLLKCVVFDLDNTIWKGIIGDDGPDVVTLNNDMIEFIYELDKRGIICSLASKNDHEIAWKKIQEFGLDEYLLFPQINWGPKSKSLFRISELLNINLDTFALIDDSEFERGEVSSVYPCVRTFTEKNVLDLLNRPDFSPTITDQSKNRRLSYLAESRRIEERDNSSLSIDNFLLSCKMEMFIKNPKKEFLRCHELILRSNQFNISGKKYNEQEFQTIVNNKYCVCWQVCDKFGDYGIVGFLTYEPFKNSVIITDFVMSCRVAEKRVEEAIFSYIIKSFTLDNRLYIKFIETHRNSPIKSKLFEIGFQFTENLSEGIILEFSGDFENLNKGIIKVIS